jgi:hypothetical protein
MPALYVSVPALDELHVDLDPVAGLRPFIALPAAVVALVALGGGQPVQAQPLEDPPHPRGAELDVVVALRYMAILAGPKW